MNDLLTDEPIYFFSYFTTWISTLAGDTKVTNSSIDIKIAFAFFCLPCGFASGWAFSLTLVYFGVLFLIELLLCGVLFINWKSLSGESLLSWSIIVDVSWLDWGLFLELTDNLRYFEDVSCMSNSLLKSTFSSPDCELDIDFDFVCENDALLYYISGTKSPSAF